MYGVTNGVVFQAILDLRNLNYKLKPKTNKMKEILVNLVSSQTLIDANTIGLFTTNKRAVIDFYTKTFGFTTNWDGVQPNVEMTLGNSRIILFPPDAFEKMSSQISNYPNGTNGPIEICFDVPTFAEVDKQYGNAVQNGAKHVMAPVTEPWGQRTCYVADPEGNLIGISSFASE